MTVYEPEQITIAQFNRLVADGKLIQVGELIDEIKRRFPDEKIDRGNVYYHLKTGTIPSLDVGGAKYIPRDLVEDYINPATRKQFLKQGRAWRSMQAVAP